MKRAVILSLGAALIVGLLSEWSAGGPPAKQLLLPNRRLLSVHDQE